MWLIFVLVGIVWYLLQPPVKEGFLIPAEQKPFVDDIYLTNNPVNVPEKIRGCYHECWRRLTDGSFNAECQQRCSDAGDNQHEVIRTQILTFGRTIEDGEIE